MTTTYTAYYINYWRSSAISIYNINSPWKLTYMTHPAWYDTVYFSEEKEPKKHPVELF